MPDMPGEIIAVRTNAHEPTPDAQTLRAGWSASVVPDHRAAKNLPIGEGYYASPRPVTQSRTDKVKHKRENGTFYEEETRYHKAIALRDPFGVNRRFMRPQIIDKTTGAMMQGIFDEIVCVKPVATSRGRKANDPIVLGRVIGPKGVSAFLIAWFVESNDI